MKIVAWILQVLLALVFLMAGVQKLITPYEEMIAGPPMDWAAMFPPAVILIIGVLEVLGAVGLIAPMAFRIKQNLVPITALCLVLDQIGAMIVHIPRGEVPMIITNSVLIVFSLIVFWARKDYLWAGH